jgi:hypothetical protein
MKLIEVPGRKKPARAAERKDVERIVKRVIKEERRFLSMMANM